MNGTIRTIVVGVACLAAVSCGGTYRPGRLGGGVTDGNDDALHEQHIARRGRWTMDDGVTLYYETHGVGRTVLTIHGGPGYPPASSWPAADALGDEYRFVYYHQRGSGLSDRPIDRFESGRWGENRPMLASLLGIEAQLTDIETIRRLLGEDRLLIVGHSYGAFMAALYAAEFPDHVERLVLIAPAQVLVMPVEGDGLFGAIEARLPEGRRAAYRAWTQELFNYRHVWSRSEAELVALHNGIMPFFETALQSYLAEIGADQTVWGWSASNATELTGGWIQPGIYLSLGRRYDLRSFLSRVAAQTTVLIGDTDFSGGPEEVRDYLDAIPGAHMTVLSGAGHFPQGDAERFSDTLRDALEGALY